MQMIEGSVLDSECFGRLQQKHFSNTINLKKSILKIDLFEPFKKPPPKLDSTL